MEHKDENIVSYIENLITGVCAFELKEGSYSLTPIYYNEGLSRMLGYSSKEIDKYVRNIRYCILPEDIPVFDQGIVECLKADGPVDTEFRTITGKGELRWLYTRCNLYSKTGDTYVIISTVVDVTEKKTADEELREQAARMHLIDTVDKESVFDYNVKSDVLRLNFVDNDGVEKEIIIPDYVAKFDPGHFGEGDVEKYLTSFHKLMNAPTGDTINLKNDRFTGTQREYELTLSSIVGLEGYVTRIVGRFIDAEKLKNVEENKPQTSIRDTIASTGQTLREIAMRTLYDGMMTEGSWEKVYDMLLRSGRSKFGGFFPVMPDGNDEPDIYIFKDDDSTFSFEDKKAKRRATAQFEDLFKNVKNITVISSIQAAGYSHSLQQFMDDNDFEKLIYYPFQKDNEYAGCIVLFNPIQDDSFNLDELRQLMSFVDTCKIQTNLSDFTSREMMIKLLMLELMDQYIYLIDFDTKRLIYANKKVLDRADDLKVGTSCFTSLMEGYTEECTNCIVSKLDPNDPHSTHTQDIFNYSLRTWIKSTAGWFMPEEKICMLTGTDISDYFIG
ncbi:MAG: PAS domain-containing protein [Lachnospiraceae bacterium]|nr:PAS domain-containing protein [Lachnospiraceae bacterium]